MKMKRSMIVLFVSLILIFAVSNLGETKSCSTESNTDRMGYDYRRISGVSTPDQCRTLCENDVKCQAYTWVKPGIQETAAVCYLKDPVPGAASNSCCVSGVVLAKSAPNSNGGSSGYWKRAGSGGQAAYLSKGPAWSSKEVFTATGGATWLKSLNGELIHQSNFTWTQLPDKVYPGQVFPLSVTGKVVFHKDPWFTSSSLLIQCFGAIGPNTYWYITDQGAQSKVTLDAKVPTGNPDKNKADHYLKLQFSLPYAGSTDSTDKFHYIYEWVAVETGVSSTSGSTVISREELMSKTWVFGRSDGTILARSMKLGANGKILDGPGHWNETSWDFKNGVLYFYGADGRSITTQYNSIKKVDGSWILSGPYAYDASITHVLAEAK